MALWIPPIFNYSKREARIERKTISRHRVTLADRFAMFETHKFWGKSEEERKLGA